MKRLAVINDLSGVGRSSLSIQLPVISALHVQACPVPTKLLSNHTGFPNASVSDLSGGLHDYFASWIANDFHMDGLLVGYLGNPEQASDILSYVSALRNIAREKNRPEPVLYLDPVMADHGKLYKNMDERYIASAQALMSEATLSFPNLTEAALLADCDYTTLQETLQNCNSDAARSMVLNAVFSELRHYTKGNIIITGIEDGDFLLNVLSTGSGDLRFFRHPKAGQNRPGTGDLFSAIVSAKNLSAYSLGDSISLAGTFIADAIAHSEALETPVLHGVQFEDLLENLYK